MCSDFALVLATFDWISFLMPGLGHGAVKRYTVVTRQQDGSPRLLWVFYCMPITGTGNQQELGDTTLLKHQVETIMNSCNTDSKTICVAQFMQGHPHDHSKQMF